uniref:tyrosyl-DNA phosphodiesterase 2-like isoform X1 n=1 Tax=Monopterus albus TaxID=43700 RepID=UPI0009B31D0F|nr:tyrosyl-DNA phosphodiesterase 2-like isoform X1 [Monopterus albus]
METPENGSPSSLRKEENTTGNSNTEAEEASCSSEPVETKEKVVEKGEEKLSLITWNVDGLDGEQQPERARGLCSCLSKYSPDVVLLQEVVQPYVRFLHNRLAADYTFIEGGKLGYFTGMMLKQSRVTLLRSKIIPYQTSHMMRNLLVAQVVFKGQELWLMTSHLESCKNNAEERMKQLRWVMKMMSKAPDNVTVLFGGDTNLRDAEVAQVGLPSCVCDVWEQLNQPEHCRFTWDTVANTNKDMRFKSRFRFDRVYLRRATKDGVPWLEPESMALVGLEKLKCGRYTSDHWGIHCMFSLSK